ncbi:MAG: hypothetical protein AAF654_01970 [Myxococcota bacterium]
MSFGELRDGNESNEDCPSDYALDRYYAGELSADERRELEERMRGCESCEAKLEQRRQGFAAFEELDSAGVWERVENQAKVIRFPRRAAWAGGLVAAAAAVLVFLTPSDRDDGTRLKGGTSLRLHRHADGGSEILSSGASARPGDRIRFEVGLPKRGVVTIYGVEAGGETYTARAPEVLEAGTGQLLKGAVVLDNALGTEILYLVRCDERSQLASCTPSTEAIECRDACDTTRFELNKSL